MAMGPQTWRWKKLTPQVILVAGLWITSSVESRAMCEIDREINWTAGTKPPSWPIIGAVILKIPIHTMITILMMGLNQRK